MLIRPSVLPVALVALGLALPTPALGFRLEAAGLENTSNSGNAVVVDGDGDVVVAGDLFEIATGSDIAVVKFDTSTGDELWRVLIDGGAAEDESASGLSIDPTGDLIVVGTLRTGPSTTELLVVKLDPATGGEIWSTQLPDAAGFALAVDAAGNAFAAGYLEAPDPEFLVVKFDGATGAEAWRQTVAGTDAGTSDSARTIAVDSAGDVYAGGGTRGPGGALDATIVKLAGATGSELWRSDFSGTLGGGEDDIVELGLDSAGDVIATGFLDNLGTQSDLLVVKLAAATGAELWRHVVNGAASKGDFGRDVAIDAAGDVAVSGVVAATPAATAWSVFAAKIDGATGAEIWSQAIKGPTARSDSASDVLITPAGDVVVTGHFDTNAFFEQMVVIRLDGTTGAIDWQQLPEGAGLTFAAAPLSGGVVTTGRIDSRLVVLSFDLDVGTIGPIAGRSIAAQDHVSLPTRRKLVARLIDDTITAPEPASADDPTVAGGALSLSNPTTGESATFPLPAGAAWKALGNPPGSKGYRYTDSKAVSGPCKKVIVQPGRLLKVVCAAKNAPMGFSLDEASQGELVVSVQLGNDPPQCGLFGGTIKRDAGTSNPGPVGRFKSTNARAYGVCPVP